MADLSAEDRARLRKRDPAVAAVPLVPGNYVTISGEVLDLLLDDSDRLAEAERRAERSEALLAITGAERIEGTAHLADAERLDLTNTEGASP